MASKAPAVSGLRPAAAWPAARAPGALRALVVKELKLKYKRSALGFLWSLLTPVALMCVYLFVFGRVFDAPQSDYGLFLLCGLVPWHFFSVATMAATTSLVAESGFIRRIHFPRILVPASTVAANLVHLVVALACLMVVLVVTGRAPWLDLHWLVLAVAMETALCLGVAFALSVWNVRLRDIGQLMAIFVVVLFFATPVVYELSQVPDGYRPLVLANPLTMIMETYRTALFERPGPPAGELLLAVGEIVLILGLGYLAFARRSRELVKDL